MKCYVCSKTSKANCEMCKRPVCRIHFNMYYDPSTRVMTPLCGNCAQIKRRELG